jgi:hypothetical protein
MSLTPFFFLYLMHTNILQPVDPPKIGRHC